MGLKEEKVLVIASCSKKKLDHPAPAVKLNQGTFFKKSRKLAKVHDFDLKILSGKYGLLDPNQIISPYNQKIQLKKDIERIRKLISLKIDRIKQEYDLIILIMGKTYQKVFKFFIDNRFRILYHPKGIFGYISMLNKYIKLSTQKLLKEIEKFNPYPNSNLSQKLSNSKIPITDFME
jgi:cytoplasmic iron level regulating protein YaaA (DUF328/UPF0246 family)